MRLLPTFLEQARFAPSGGNRQGWKVLVVREDASRARLRELIEPQMQRYVAQVKAGEAPLNTINPSQVCDAQIADTQVPQSMLDNLTGAPVFLLVFVDLSVVASFDSGWIGWASFPVRPSIPLFGIFCWPPATRAWVAR